MARLRYFVDRPPGPRGGNNDSGPYYNLDSAKRHAEPRAEKRYQDRVIERALPQGTIRVVDLDLMPMQGADSDEEFAWHEAQMQHHACEAQRLKPGVDLRTATEFLTGEDLTKLRQAIEHHFTIIDRHERARTWRTKAGREAQRQLEELLKKLLKSGKLGGPPR